MYIILWLLCYLDSISTEWGCYWYKECWNILLNYCPIEWDVLSYCDAYKHSYGEWVCCCIFFGTVSALCKNSTDKLYLWFWILIWFIVHEVCMSIKHHLWDTKSNMGMLCLNRDPPTFDRLLRTNFCICNGTPPTLQGCNCKFNHDMQLFHLKRWLTKIANLPLIVWSFIILVNKCWVGAV